MPSLNELREFKASFQHIGGEKANLAAKDIPFDDLELPDTEPEPIIPADAALDNTAEPEIGIDPADDIDFSAFLDSQPDDLPEPLDVSTDDLYAPDGLLSNLSEELDAIPPDFPEETGEITPPEPQPGLESEGSPLAPQPSLESEGSPLAPQPSLESEGSPLAPQPSPEGEGSPLDLDSLDNFDMPEEPLSDINLDDFGDLNLPEEPAAANIDTPDTPDEDSLGLDDLGSLDVPGDSMTADSDESLNLDDFGLPEEPDASEDVAAADSSDENFNLDDLELPDEAVAADSGESLDIDNLGDLDLPDETAAADSGESLDIDNLGDLDLPDETAAADSGESLNIDNLGDLDLPDEVAAADSGESLDIDNLGDLDLPDEVAAADSGESLDIDNLGDLDLPDETTTADSAESLDLPDETATADSDENLDLNNLDNFSLPEESDSFEKELAAGGSESPDDFDELASTDHYDNIELDNLDDDIFDDKPASKQTNIDDDFSFDELDDVLQKTHKKKKELAAPAPVVKSKQRGKEIKRKKIDTALNDVSEIQISDDEMEGLLETLSRYPLNLRIACEEIISEEIGSVKQVAELIEHLVWGASAKETAVLASHILDRTIVVPKGFEKSTGEELEAEQASFAYIFVHRFLPVLRLFTLIAIVAASFFYLVFRFVYTPLKAESIYKIGYERIFVGEYQRANERFTEAFNIYRKKSWFYKYAEAFRDERQYIYAEQKYDELLQYYPRDKKGVLDYANLETYYLRNYAKADNILRWNLLDYAPNDREGLLAAGDNCLVWGDVDPAKYEDARYYYARLLEKYGWQAPVVERMMKYFIRTDNLREILPLKIWFDNNRKYELSAETLGELGGYLLDKQLEEVKGVPNEYVEQIGSVRELLLKAVYADPSLPEPHYHLARYYQHLGSAHEELVSLRVANRAFDDAPEGSVRRLKYRIDALQRYADALINTKEFFPAEEQLVKGINLYEDAVSRRLISRSPKYGKLYATMGDLEYFTKIGDMEAALRFYHRSEQDGWAPPEMQYRMGAAYYQLENWRNALEYLFAASKDLPLNRRILFALGNTALKRGDYFAANGYYNRLLDILESQRARLPILLPNDRPEYLELAERLMMAQNNAGVACEMLAAQTGSRNYHTRALAFYAEANRAWDARTRDPRSMIRSGSTPLPYLNSRNALYPQVDYEPQIFIRIDREASETSPWEELAALARLDGGR